METYPRQAAATGQFRYGVPRSIRITEQAVYFLRSASGRSPVLELHRWDRASGETMTILSGSGSSMTAAERALRERLRESASGITAYDVRGERVVATAAGSVLAWDAEGARTLSSQGAFDARLSPDGQWVSWVAGGALLVCPWSAGEPRVIVEPEGDETWAVVDFIAAEELDRSRGYWWLPDSSGLLVQRTDDSRVQVWHRADPAHPQTPPVPQRYPAACTPNAEVELWRFDLEGEGARMELPEHEYLVDVSSVISTFDRAQTELTIVDLAGEPVSVLRGEPWLDLVPGLPRRDKAGRLLAWVDGTRRWLTIDGEPWTAPDVHLRSVVGVMDGAVYVLACDDPAETRLARVDEHGFTWLTPPGATVNAVCGHGLLVTSEVDWDTYRATVTIRDGDRTTIIENLAEEPVVSAAPQRVTSGVNEIQTVVLLPSEPVDGPLPVLMAPYGGPHAQRVLAARSAYASGQWLADQGFCVVIADGRGTPGQSPAWEHSVAGNLRDPALEDQVLALQSVAAQYPVDLQRVGILGWSYGGYLAALGVLQRPDVFHAAVAGAPVTDWRLYDTAYTERYLGLEPGPYDHCSLLPLAPQLERPLLLIHGLADDNVFAAHTLQMSQALLEAGRPHEVLPLSGVSHMTPQPEVAENLLLLQVDFFRRHLGKPVEPRV